MPVVAGFSAALAADDTMLAALNRIPIRGGARTPAGWSPALCRLSARHTGGLRLGCHPPDRDWRARPDRGAARERPLPVGLCHAAGVAGPWALPAPAAGDSSSRSRRQPSASGSSMRRRTCHLGRVCARPASPRQRISRSTLTARYGWLRWVDTSVLRRQLSCWDCHWCPIAGAMLVLSEPRVGSLLAGAAEPARGLHLRDRA